MTMADEQHTPSEDIVEDEIRELGQTVSSRAANESAAADVANERSERKVATWPVAAVLVVITAGLTAMNVAEVGIFRRSAPPPDPAEISRGLEVELLAAVGYVEDYRTEHGRLPGSLEAMGLGGDEFEFTPTDDGYRIVVAREGQRREYDSRLALEGAGGGS
jgi:hypothetical protein